MSARWSRLSCGLPPVGASLLALLFAATPCDSQALSSARATRALRSVDMNGECAVVAHHDSWEDEGTAQMNWNYKIKVYPWTTFAHVTVKLSPPVTVEHVWAASILSEEIVHHSNTDSKEITVELGHKPQDDFTFDLSGTGKVKHVEFSCEKVEVEESTCGLEPSFSVLNNYDGIISPRVHVETWQIGAIVDMAFDIRLTVRSPWGAEVVDDDKEDESNARGQTVSFRLLPQARGIPPERKSSFGFEATPPFHSAPTIRCTLKKELPPPPPPSPPWPNPPPPVRALISARDCFLRGRVNFVTPPSRVGMPWRFDVTLDTWVPDVLLTINFVGDTYELQRHPLQIESVEPNDAVWQDSLTTHSVTYRLKRTADGFDPGPLEIVAYGLVEGLGGINCCCGSPPPPPPDAPPSPEPSPPPSPHPARPPPPPFATLQNRQIDGGVRKSAFTQTEKPKKVETVIFSREILLVVLVLGGFIHIGHKNLEKFRDYQKGIRTSTSIREKLEEMRTKADANKPEDGPEADSPNLGGSRCRNRRSKDELQEADSEPPDEEAILSASDSETMNSDQPEERTQLFVEVTKGMMRKRMIDLSDIETMKQLQRYVVDEWELAGGKRADALIVEFADEEGEWVPVTRSVLLPTIKAARQIRLSLKRKARSSCKDSQGYKRKDSQGYKQVNQEETLPTRCCSGREPKSFKLSGRERKGNRS